MPITTSEVMQLDAIGKASELTLYVLLTAAVVSDLRFGKVSNRLILSGCFLSILFRGIQGGASQIVWALPNMFFPVIILFLFFLCGALGAGDIKLFSVIGGFFTFQRLVAAMVCSFFLGAVWSLLLLLRRKSLSRDLLQVFSYAKDLLDGRQEAYPAKKENRICFTPFILAGAVLSAFLF